MSGLTLSGAVVSGTDTGIEASISPTEDGVSTALPVCDSSDAFSSLSRAQAFRIFSVGVDPGS